MALAAVVVSGASYADANRIVGAVLALVAAVIGYLHNGAGAYTFELSGWQPLDLPPLEGTDWPDLHWEIVVPAHWVRGRAAFAYVETDGGLLVGVGADVLAHTDGTIHLRASRDGDRDPPELGRGEVRFGG